MKNNIAFLSILVTLSCSNQTDYSNFSRILNENYYKVNGISTVYVFDEYSCGVCFDNLVSSVSKNKKEFIVLYATENVNLFDYTNSQLVGYTDKEKIIPVNYEIISHLRTLTETIKGNYEINFQNEEILSIRNF